MGLLHYDVKCPSCGGDAVMEKHTNETVPTYFCEGIHCENYPHKFEQFEYRVRKEDYGIGDSFWLEGFEFTVTNTCSEPISGFPKWYQDVLKDEDSNPLPPGFGPQGHGVND